jgi:hypothetical protein
MAVDTTFPTSRRSMLRLAVFTAILSALPTGKRVVAQEEAALLVSKPGTLGPDFEGIVGAKICAGGRAGAKGKTTADDLRESGAAIILMPTSERLLALEKGLCDAVLFVGEDYSQLERDITDFFPEVQYYEIKRYKKLR